MLIVCKCFILSCFYFVGNVAARIQESETFKTNIENASITEASTENDQRQNESPNIIFTDTPELTIYFNLKDNTTVTTILPRPTYGTFNSTLRLPFIGGPCDCFGVTCGCCMGMRVPFFNIKRQMCANVSYVPQEFGLNLAFMSNDEALINHTISAKNPPAICVPLPLPVMWAPTLGVCVRFHDIHTYSVNMHICINFEFRVDSKEVLILKFNCVDLGTEGVHLTKPGDQQSVSAAPEIEPEAPEQVDVDIYDPVYETIPGAEISVVTSNQTTSSEEDFSVVMSNQTTTPELDISVSTSDQATSPQIEFGISPSNQTTSSEIDFGLIVFNQTTAPEVDINVSMTNQTTPPEDISLSTSNQPMLPEMDISMSTSNQATSPEIDVNIATSNQITSPETGISISTSNQPTSSEMDIPLPTSNETTSPEMVNSESTSNLITSPETVISVSKSNQAKSPISIFTFDETASFVLDVS